MQKAIFLKNVAYAIRERPILNGVSFRCDIKERLCILGENGAGKSTLLKILCGQIQADEGVIEQEGHVRFTYVAQEFSQEHKALTVKGYIKEVAGDALAKKVANFTETLGFKVADYEDKLCGSLSGGQQKILALSSAFAISPDFILLDEPENHLDIVSRLELISLLKDFRGGIIFISHDRLLIDALASKIGELAGGKMYISEGDYEDYIQSKMERIGGLQRQYDTESKRIRQLSSAIVILHQKALRGKEISAYRRAKEELEQLKKDHKESGRPDDKKTKIRIAQPDSKLHDGKLLLRVRDARFKYDGAKANTFSDVDLDLWSGNKIVLLGRNGSGKSTFLKALTGELPLTHGTVAWSNNVKWAYFDQHAEFDLDQNAIQIVGAKLGFNDSDSQAALGAMKFDSARMNTVTRNLSGGERMRLRFAMVFARKPDFIILDEPTNHIDEVTWEILLETCIKSKSSILLVTHDYEFIQAFNPSLFWVMNNQTVTARHKDLDLLLDELKGGNKG